jgi:hypothetical protein
MDRDKHDILSAEKLVGIGKLRVLSEAFAGTAEKKCKCSRIGVVGGSNGRTEDLWVHEVQ